MSTSFSSSGSTVSVSSDVGDDSAVEAKTISSNSADSCTWYASGSCNRPRTCYDCLNVQVASGECAILSNGMCVGLTEYSQFLDNQQNFGIYYKYYPSSNYTYCSADDTVCSACSSNWVSTYTTTGSIEAPTYCTGLDGCICLARCELPDWSTSILTSECDSNGNTGVDSNRTSTASRIGFALAVGLAFGVLLGLWGIKLLFRRHDGSGRGSSIPVDRETWTVPRRRRTGPQLALTGWKQLREKLIAIEKEVYGGTEVTTQARRENPITADAPDSSMEEGRMQHSKQISQLETQMVSQATTSTSSDYESSNVTKTTSSDTSDSCTWYAGKNCSQPRTGYDCLNVLLTTDDCAIDPNGACVSMSVYKQYLSDREYYEPQSRYFPSDNYTYCNVNDSVCSACITEWTTNYETTGSVGARTYCAGSDGCVCVAAAEIPNWDHTVIANQCDGSNDSDSVSSSEFSSGTRICIILGLCVSAVMIFTVFAVRKYAQPRNSGECRIESIANSETNTYCSDCLFVLGSAHRSSKGPQLSLIGWKSLREKLIETEHSFVKSDTTRLDSTTRSAEALAEAPEVTVEICSGPRQHTPQPVETQYMMAPM
ncbi:Hypothetical protein PHPALM_14246 [Phytophthora palmivora]|uniref:Uncharacterized protein n=1 Tax=Phytophthora palmivora TaxID=4796 RepID=A0A2P4XV76_9STRA|nr:Hypothetical protein PHPALM_14246 [Phytophthora palmivora]